MSASKTDNQSLRQRLYRVIPGGLIHTAEGTINFLQSALLCWIVGKGPMSGI